MKYTFDFENEELMALACIMDDYLEQLCDIFYGTDTGEKMITQEMIDEGMLLDFKILAISNMLRTALGTTDAEKAAFYALLKDDEEKDFVDNCIAEAKQYTDMFKEILDSFSLDHAVETKIVKFRNK